MIISASLDLHCMLCAYFCGSLLHFVYGVSAVLCYAPLVTFCGPSFASFIVYLRFATPFPTRTQLRIHTLGAVPTSHVLGVAAATATARM